MTISEENNQELVDQVTRPGVPTKRVVSEGAERHLYLPYHVLDHGLIRLIDYMGDDSAVVQAARVSYGRGTKSVQEDKNLIEYLMRHHHWTPFEMVEIKLHVKLPIFVARQWIRHRTANVNEYSARYSILAREFYIPEQQHLAPQNKNNRQGRSTTTLEADEAAYVQEGIAQHSERAYDIYTDLLNEGNAETDKHPGIARELARMVLPVNYYTEWYWKTDIRNLLNFLYLRCDPHAQWEIRAYADLIAKIVQDWVPMIWAAYDNVMSQGRQLTGRQLEVLRRLLVSSESGNVIEHHREASQISKGHIKDMGKREWEELIAIFKE